MTTVRNYRSQHNLWTEACDSLATRDSKYSVAQQFLLFLYRYCILSYLLRRDRGVVLGDNFDFLAGLTVGVKNVFDGLIVEAAVGRFDARFDRSVPSINKDVGLGIS